MEEKYERLPKEVAIRGTGIDGLTATLIERTENKAIYKRCDGVYEVFRIRKADAMTLFGKQRPAQEMYPSNNEFGNSAWAYVDKTIAMELYKSIPDKAILITATEKEDDEG